MDKRKGAKGEYERRERGGEPHGCSEEERGRTRVALYATSVALTHRRQPSSLQGRQYHPVEASRRRKGQVHPELDRRCSPESRARPTKCLPQHRNRALHSRRPIAPYRSVFRTLRGSDRMPDRSQPCWHRAGMACAIRITNSITVTLMYNSTVQTIFQRGRIESSPTVLL